MHCLSCSVSTVRASTETLDASCATNRPASCSQRHPSADGYHSAPSFTHHRVIDPWIAETQAKRSRRQPPAGWPDTQRVNGHKQADGAGSWCWSPAAGRLAHERDRGGGVDPRPACGSATGAGGSTPGSPDPDPVTRGIYGLSGRGAASALSRDRRGTPVDPRSLVWRPVAHLGVRRARRTRPAPALGHADARELRNS